MKRGSIFIVSLLMLLGVIILLLLIGKLGINGYTVYGGKFDNLALQKNAGITGDSFFGDLGDWFENFILGKEEQVGGQVNLLAPPFGRTIYVDNNLTGDCLSGNYNITGRSCWGSDGVAFNTLIGASNNVTAGTTVLIRGGVYNTYVSVNNNDVIWPKQSGTPEQPIIFRNYDGERVVLGHNPDYLASYPNDAWASIARRVITLNYTNNIVIDGLVIESLAGWVYARGVENVTLQNNIFNMSLWEWKGSVIFTDSHYNRIVNNTFYNNTDDSLVLVNSNYNLVENNTFDIAQHSIFAIRCGNYNVIRGNNFRNSWKKADGMAEKIAEVYDCKVDTRDPANPLYIPEPKYDSTKYNLFEHNFFGYHPSWPNHGAQPSAIQFSGQNTIIRNNIFSNPAGVRDPVFPTGEAGGRGLAIRWGGSWEGWLCNSQNTSCRLVGEGHEAGFVTHNRIYNNLFYGYAVGQVLVPSDDSVSNLPNPPPMRNVEDYQNYPFERMYEFGDNIFKNNIFYEANITSPINWRYLMELNGRPVTAIILGNINTTFFENNNFYASGNYSDELIYYFKAFYGGTGGYGGGVSLPSQNPAYFNEYYQTFTGNVQYEPGFVNANGSDFKLVSTSPLIDRGAFLTRAVGSGSGTTIVVEDASYFYDGFGILGEVGDIIVLKGQTGTAQIVSIDYASNTLTLDRSLQWIDGQGVALTYSGSAPDIGAYEYNPGTSGCMTQGELNIEIQRFVNGQIGIVPVTNKVVSYLGC